MVSHILSMDPIYLLVIPNDFAAIAIGKSPIGVDVERHRMKVKRVAQKFVNPNDQAPLRHHCCLNRPVVCQRIDV